MPFDFKFNLGDEVRDTISSYSGVVSSRSQWLNGCNTYGVKTRELKDGKPIDAVFFDEPQLELVVAKAVETPRRDTGGPCVEVPQPNR